MHRSIMQNLKVRKCYLCRWSGDLEVHHCLHGTANRRLAEEDGLLVNLCIDCHRQLHEHGTNDKELMQDAERHWLKYNMEKVPGFIARYGKNYLEEE